MNDCERSPLQARQGLPNVAREPWRQGPEHLYTLGEYNIVMVTEFPDDDTAAAAVLALASLGNVRTKTMRAFTDGETAAIIAQPG